jgi:hypothetical protein
VDNLNFQEKKAKIEKEYQESKDGLRLGIVLEEKYTKYDNL